MSRWVPEPGLETPGTEVPEGGLRPEPQPERIDPSERKIQSRAPAWIAVFPFFLSAALFASGLFSLFAPLPLLLLATHPKGGRWVLAAAGTNALLVAALTGFESAIFFGVFAAIPGVVFPLLALRRSSVERSVGLTLLAVALGGGVAWVFFSMVQGSHPVSSIGTTVSAWVGRFVESLPPDGRKALLGDSELADLQERVLAELPSGGAIFGLVLVWINAVLVIRLNPSLFLERAGWKASLLREWKAPELLLWPTIASGFFLVVEAGVVSVVAVNLFKVLMAIYAIQGLSILAFVLDFWKVRGPLRPVAVLVAVFLMMPLVLSLGFFDAWFDFRSKFRQS